MNFNTAAFEAGLSIALEQLGNAEKITKETLKVWANKVLEATHATGQCAYMNKLIAVLTPVNKRVAIMFLTHFSGFHYDEKTALFDHKHKKRYAQALIDWNKFSADPLNNIWVWSERHVTMEVKPFTLEDVSKATSKLWKNAHAAGMTNGQVLAAMLTAKDKDKAIVFTMDDVIEALGSLSVAADLTVGQDSVFVRGEQEQAQQEDAPI